MIERLEKQFSWSKTALVIAAIAFGVSVVSLLMTLQNLGKQNNTYLRAMACFVSVPASERTPEYIKYCYEKAENTTGAKIDRYGNGL